jgi:hypothetical protein
MQKTRARRTLQQLALAAICAAGVLGGALVACGPLDEDIFGPPSGRTCYENADCVPDGCCGQATAAIHKDDATSCTGVVCQGSCPVDQVDCGCGLPVCKEQRCTVARQVDARCD